MMEKIRKENNDLYIAVVKDVASVYLSLVVGIDHLQPEQMSNDGVINFMPSCTPSALAQEGPTNFNALFNLQRTRLLGLYNEKDLSQLEDEYTLFLDSYNLRSGTMKNFLDSLPKNATFEQRWKDISTNYPLLVQFAGGLHSVFLVQVLWRVIFEISNRV